MAQSDSKFSLSPFLRRFRVPILFAIHAVLFVMIFWVAVKVRDRDDQPWYQTSAGFFRLVWMVTSVKLAIFFVLRSFHGWWRHVTFSDLLFLARAATVSLIVVAFVAHFFPSYGSPRGVLLVDWMLTIVVLSGFRSMWRFWDERVSPTSAKRTRALLVGDQADAAQLAHLINSRHQLSHRVVGLVAPGPSSPTIRFSDLKVVGCIKDIERLRREYRASRLLIPTGSVSGQQIRDLLDQREKLSLEINVIPPLSELLNGTDRIPIRPVQFNDLLRRDPVKLDSTSIKEMVSGSTVLVTGAGGSIGSELCRQIINFGPRKLVLLGRGENRIFHIHRELLELKVPVELVTVIANVTDLPRIEEVFSRHSPEVVFHAAAHKHVPLTENNVGEAIINNVMGTKIVADLACDHRVKKFLLVSTDKAVNPTSVMGCTKQLAERYCLSLGHQSKTRFVVTRFGNVLGSEGSVVPLFQKQIQRGGPITITDPAMTRYFMTIPEASQLVLQAAAMGNGGEIFVLEMGEPIRILDMAHDLIRLAGLPLGSIEIVFTGKRPGEKTYEELYYNEEESCPTQHPKILAARHRHFDHDNVCRETNDLIQTAYDAPVNIYQRLKILIPEYHRPERDSLSDSDTLAESPENLGVSLETVPHRGPLDRGNETELPRKAR